MINEMELIYTYQHEIIKPRYNYQYLKSYRNKFEKKNKDKLIQYYKTKITCECGSVFRRSDKSYHLKTKKHLHYIENNGQRTE